MTTTEPPIPRVVPMTLAFVAGYVDAVTFLALFGLFVAQVTGSFVVAGAQLVSHSNHWLVTVLAIPAFFGGGVAATLLADAMIRHDRRPLPWTLALETALLTAFSFVALFGRPFADADAPAALVATLFGLSAMGVQSAMVRLLFRGVASTNVMTTNTTQLAIDATQTWLAWRARRRSGDADAEARYREARVRLNALWPILAMFLVGTAIGAGAVILVGLWCLAPAVGALGALTLWAALR